MTATDADPADRTRQNGRRESVEMLVVKSSVASSG